MAKLQFETVNWAKLSQDVFKAPNWSCLYSIMIGVSIQYAINTYFFLVFVTLGTSFNVHIREKLYL